MDRPLPNALVIVIGALTCCACTSRAEPSVAAKVAAIIYDGDQREELFELPHGPLRALVAGSVVAFLRKDAVVTGQGAATVVAATRANSGVCSDERFADQPSAAVCSGVLVDWDLVLTAGHCVRAFPLDQLLVAFDYYYRASGELALDPDDLFEPSEVVHEALLSRAGRSTLDYAFVRLAHGADPQRQPASIRTRMGGAQPGAALISAGASEGVPIKVDRGATVRVPGGEDWNYFTADTDTFQGGSGGAAFDDQHALLGVLMRGGEDLVQDDRCYRARRLPGDEAEEAFTYAGRALAELCSSEPGATTLCRMGCGDPCRALAPAAQAGSCALSPPRAAAGGPLAVGLLLACWFACALRAVRARAPACDVAMRAFREIPLLPAFGGGSKGEFRASTAESGRSRGRGSEPRTQTSIGSGLPRMPGALTRVKNK